MPPATLTRPPRADAVAEPRPAVGLVMDMETMSRRLERELSAGPTLDAYLFAAGVAQIVDDHLHRPVYPFGRAADYLAGLDARAARLAAGGAAAIDGAARAARRCIEATRTAAAWRGELDALIDALADVQVGSLLGSAARLGAERSDDGPAAITRSWTPGLAPLPRALRETVVRVPTCFAHFDQRPADVVRLALRFAERRPDRECPLLVTGVRTSGAYLAPLCAATLRALGYRDVATLSVRPGHHLLAHERHLVRAVASRGGRALVLDDPPVTGGAVRDAAATLAHAGIDRRAIVLLLALFGEAEAPARLRDHESVLIGGAEWSVEDDLSPAAVQRTLESLLGGPRVLAVEPVPSPYPQPARGHRRELFRVQTLDDASGQRERERLVLVEGVGLGYLGAHRLPVPALRRFSAPVFGLRDGLLYREWLPDERRLRPPAPHDEDEVAEQLAGYAAARRAALACPRDLSLRMGDEQPAWLIASRILAAGFGRGWPVARVVATDRATRALARVPSPSVVDGNTDLAHWFRGDDPPALVKPDIGEDGFSNLTAQCFDAAFDLAGVSARGESTTLPGRLRGAFRAASGEAVDAERWLLYELVHLWGRERVQPSEKRALRRASARAVQRYFADTDLAGVTAAPDGPLCALDIDGVLEAQRLGFSMVTPTAALCLRALLVHGYRPVLATGRSLDEVTERCRAYGLPGAVAEYGSVVLRAGDGRVRSLLDDLESRALARLRAALVEADDIDVDPDYRCVVRAFSRQRGHRVALSAEQTARALTAAGGGGCIRVIAGDGQTDFVGRSVDKGRGLRALAEELGCRTTPPYALAVGDTHADLAFVDVAARACAPGHADPALGRAGMELMRRPYQAGTAEAVRGLIGHEPGGCALCRAPAPTRERSLLLELLAVSERGPAGLVRSALQLRWQARASRSGARVLPRGAER